MTKKIKVPTDKEIYAECRARYYCAEVEFEDGDEDDLYNQLCEEYENWSDEDVEELIKSDVVAMKRFLK